MYFASRVQAGRTLASQLAEKYRYENCAVVALNDGGVMVGAQIAVQLHCSITLMMSAEIHLPQEPVSVAGITPSGTMAYNNTYEKGQLDELIDEYRGYVEQEKLHKMHELNQLVGTGGTINKEMLRGQNVIVVSDGIGSGFEIDLVYEFLKPVALQKLIFAVPVASVQAVDRMHVLADELLCLDVVADYQEAAHYYETKDVPDHETVLRVIEKIVLEWK
jgi:predicted phosphoribosyltransferase